jgi:hypothetical protein
VVAELERTLLMLRQVLNSVAVGSISMSSVEAHVDTHSGGFRSYRDVLLGRGVPPVSRDPSDVIGLNLNWHMRYR